MKYDGMSLEEFKGMMGELGADVGTATQATPGGDVPSGTHTATGVTSTQKRGAFRAGDTRTTYNVRELTPEEVAKVGNYAKVQGVKLSTNQSLYVPIGTVVKSDGSTSGGAPVIQAGSEAAAGAELTRAVESGELTPQQAGGGGLLSRRFFGLPVWLWLTGGAVAAGGIYWWSSRRAGK